MPIDPFLVNSRMYDYGPPPQYYSQGHWPGHAYNRYITEVARPPPVILTTADGWFDIPETWESQAGGEEQAPKSSFEWRMYAGIPQQAAPHQLANMRESQGYWNMHGNNGGQRHNVVPPLLPATRPSTQDREHPPRHAVSGSASPNATTTFPRMPGMQNLVHVPRYPVPWPEAVARKDSRTLTQPSRHRPSPRQLPFQPTELSGAVARLSLKGAENARNRPLIW